MNFEQFQQKLAESARPVVVYFWAPWCMPCRFMAPAFAQAQSQFDGQVELWKLNADENTSLLQSLQVYGIPTLIVFREGKEINRHTGAKTSGELQAWIAKIALGQSLPNSTPTQGIRSIDRILRLGVGATLATLGYFSGPAWLLVGAGALIAFTGVYDRCPIWQIVSTRLKTLFSKTAERVP
jgi:thioredoxin